MVFHLLLAGVYAELGNAAEVRAEVKEVLRISPDYSLGIFRQTALTMDSKFVERIVASLHKIELR